MDYLGENTTKCTEPSQEPNLNFLSSIVKKKGKINVVSWITAMSVTGEEKKLGKALQYVSCVLWVKVEWDRVRGASKTY